MYVNITLLVFLRITIKIQQYVSLNMDHEYSQYKIVGIATFNRDVTNVMLKEHIINKVDMANATVNNVDVLEKVDDTYLVELYRERRFLYDKSHPDFKDNELKSNAWKEISSIMRDKNLGTFYTAEYCKRRLTNLREQYVRLKKEQTLKSGSIACSKKKSALLSELSFLDGYIQRRRTLTSMKKNNGRMPAFSFDKNATKCPETNVTESINLNKRTYKKILPRPNNIGDDLTKNLYDQTPSKILKQSATSKKNNGQQQQQFDVGSTSVEHAFAKFIALSLQRMEEPERSIRRNKIFHDLTAPLEHVQSGPCDKKSPARSMVSGIAVTKNTHPIRVTHAALAWNSVKTGKSEIKEFTIHNTSNNKIEIQIDICDDNKSFKFIGDKQTVNTSMVLTMRHQEIKTLAVAFNPYCVGPVVGKITIKHYTKESSDPQSQQYKKIPLYGYGGCSKVKIAGTFKDLSGNMWLSLGTLYSETTLSANIRLNNVGDLRSFATITVIPKVTFSTNSSWHVNPKEVILNAKESQQIAIQFHPKKEDFAFVQHSEVSHIATINITYGDEPTRWRIRSVCDKIKPDELTKNENEDVISIVFPICKSFPGEQLVPGIASLGDSIQNLSDLCSGVHQSEIMLTVEACTDDTLPVHDTADAEISVISDTIRVDEAGGV